jgi:hypothetical protein
MYPRKKEAKKTSQRTTRGHPQKLPISVFDDGGEYSPVVIVLRYSHRLLPALAK